ncbi:Hcp family type VI secretion system effector [Limoniibacter endophyticus]|uniref:Type VI secretion system secreted protein Hcp n=1 Tax=Limoniibacter endophyticus TaxID=1565040 RepID=A0A8J3DPM7_9HYPH|nr:type VI secretion system tube protein Hcp [Limoniibacter endophyticus]GHC69482.1 hypothetical protein GCM10010136_15370 [Limoniibacter endophyticus]
MAIYLKIPGITGDVTEQAHKGWIEINNFQLGIHRYIHTEVGRASNREGAHAHVDEITFNKVVDSASPQLAQKALKGGNGDTVQIHFVNVDGTYEEFTLTNALISNFVKQSADGTSSQEHISLNFTKIEMSYTPRTADNANGSKVRTTYNLEDAKVA